MSNTDRAWLNFSSEQQLDYLNQCRRRAETGRKAVRCAVLQGEFVHSKSSFLCELGQAVFGVGGWCGGDFEEAQAVFDGKTAAADASTLQKIIWRDADLSMLNLGEDDFYRCLAVLQNSLRDCTLVYRHTRFCK